MLYERQMSSRLRGYINALISDNIDFISADKEVDLEALNLLYMIKTITNPLEFAPYLKVISTSAKMEDYGTALFYLEELLKNGYANKIVLYIKIWKHFFIIFNITRESSRCHGV